MAETVLHLTALAVLAWRASLALRGSQWPLLALFGVAAAFVLHDLLT